MKEVLLSAAEKMGIGAAGFCRARVFDELRDVLTHNMTKMASGSIEERINPFLQLCDAKSIMVCLFSYNRGDGDTNLSRYARGMDYHTVVVKRLEKLADILRKQGFSAKCFCDTGLLCDRYLAYCAGLGFFGRNRALINTYLGSYTFIGYILTSAEIPEDTPMDTSCAGCGMCQNACPGGALGDGGFCEEKCASYLTQKKGELSDEERAIIKKSGSAWGCDICQRVCPHNQGVKVTDIAEFNSELIPRLTQDMAKSGREFKKIYAERAFSWRGYGVILRNLKILED